MKFLKSDILSRLNASGVTKNRAVRWQYQDKSNPGKHGFAQVRFEHGERFLIAETIHWGKDVDIYKLDDFEIEDMNKINRPESFELKAHRNWVTNEYEIISIFVDGEEYNTADTGLIELAFSIFLARADEIETLGKETKIDTGYVTKPSNLYANKSENIHRNMPNICFGDHLLAFSKGTDIQGVA